MKPFPSAWGGRAEYGPPDERGPREHWFARGLRAEAQNAFDAVVALERQFGKIEYWHSDGQAIRVVTRCGCTCPGCREIHFLFINRAGKTRCLFCDEGRLSL